MSLQLPRNFSEPLLLFFGSWFLGSMLPQYMALSVTKSVLLVTGCLKKKGDLFCDQYLHQIKHKFAWYISQSKDGINSSVWSTKTLLYHIREPRYKQTNMGYQISRISNNEQSNIFKYDINLMYT